jgi:hypothetical protein
VSKCRLGREQRWSCVNVLQSKTRFGIRLLSMSGEFLVFGGVLVYYKFRVVFSSRER